MCRFAVGVLTDDPNHSPSASIFPTIAHPLHHVLRDPIFFISVASDQVKESL